MLIDLAGARAEMYTCRLNGKLRQPRAKLRLND